MPTEQTQTYGTPGDRSTVPRGFNPCVHGARGAFALAVFVFHIANSGLPTAPFLAAVLPKTFLLSLQFGVELFFCISGYVIAGTLRRATSPGLFLYDRLIRILPVLWATMPFVIVLEYIGHEPVMTQLLSSLWMPILVANLLCLPTVVPVPLLHYAAWSLSYEMAFYALAALGWYLLRRGRHQALLVALPAALLLFYRPRSLFFLPGLLTAGGILDTPFFRPLTRYPLPFLLIFLGAWWEAGMLSHGDFTTGMEDWSVTHAILGTVALAAACIGFQGIADGTGVLGRILRTRLLQFLGTISYSLYLWQFVTMVVIKHAMIMAGLVPILGPWSQAAFLLLALPPTLLIAWISQHVLERGVSGWLRRREKRSRQVSPA